MSVRRDIDLCVLVPCYNNFVGLIKSVESIFYAANCLVLIVDDGSTEPLDHEKIKRQLSHQVHFHILRLEQNVGITRALNLGLDFIYKNFSTRFIARLDCGDICTTDRFYRQVKFLESNPDIHLLGSWCYFKNFLTGATYQFVTPTTHNDIRNSMYFKNVFVHPTVMWRCSGTGRLKYPEQYPHAEDYGLFYAMISTTRSAILNEFLVTCEINRQGISISNRAVQLNSRLKVMSQFNKNSIRGALGVIRLKLLMLLPHNLVLETKKLLYRAT